MNYQVSQSNLVSIPIEVLKARMELYYKRARQSQQRGAYWNERWIKASFPEKEKEKPEVVEGDFGNNQE